jgi:hypothetical protein
MVRLIFLPIFKRGILINRPEYERQISNKVRLCPHCGFPLSVDNYPEIE